MERTFHPGDTQNRCRLASCRLSAVLEMAFTSQVEGRSQAGEQTDSRLNFSNGCGKSNLGSAPHSWRVAQARLRSLSGSEGDSRPDPGSRALPLVSGTLIAVEDHAIQSAAFQGKGLLHRRLGRV